MNTSVALPGLTDGQSNSAGAAVREWIIVSWLLVSECLAYVEDLEGGTEQPQMQQAATMGILEILGQVDARLSGRAPASGVHQLALVLEYGLPRVLTATGEQVCDLFGLTNELLSDRCDTSGTFAAWDRIVGAFPGVLFDRLVAEGQRDVLVSMRAWNTLCREAGIDIAFLEPFIRDV